MSEARNRLGRLLAIRRLSSELDRRALQVTLGAVREVESAQNTQELAKAEAWEASRAALLAGERGEWLLAVAKSEVAALNRAGLDRLLQERAAAVPPAMQRFLDSRLEHEQVKQLVENARLMERTEADRAAQSAADDWFLSRRMRRANARPGGR